MKISLVSLLSQQSSLIQDVLFVPETGKISGCVLPNMTFISEEYIIFSEKKLVFSSQNKSAQTGVSLLLLPAISREGKSLGAVTDILFETQTMTLIDITVTQKILGFPLSKTLFERKRIYEITKDSVIIDDSLEKVPASYALQYR